MLADASWFTRPVSNEPSDAVTVCACEPLFVQVTIPPTGTTAAKPHALMSVGLASVIATGVGLVCAVATAGNAVRAMASSPAMPSSPLLRSFIGTSRVGIVDDDGRRHPVQAGRAVRLAVILKRARC